MSIKINIYGRDYSEVEFNEYNEHTYPYSGVEFQGKSYNVMIAKVITCKFLQEYCKDVSKYTIGSDEFRTDSKDFCCYTQLNDKLYYQNIVGVLQCKQFTLTEKDIKDFANLSNESVEEIVNSFNEYLDEAYEVKLQIQSRFDGNHTYFLPTMLLYGKIDLNDDTVPSNSDELFKFLLVYWYKEQLEMAYIQGPYRTYQRFEKNDDRFRGCLDIGVHVRLNLGLNNGKIAYSYRENTTDNALNHLILHTYGHIKKYFPNLAYQLFERDYEMKRVVDEINDLAPSFKGSNVGQVIGQNYRIISHPFYLNYEKLRKTCMQILNHRGVSIFDRTEEDEVRGILFYVPDLWELYLASQMKMYLNFRVESQEKIKIFRDIEDIQSKSGKQDTYPDFIFYTKENTPFMVLDAKFKKKWGDKYYGQGKMDLDDYTKCVRDMNSLGVHATGVIFPTNKEINLEDEKQKLVHGVSEYNQYDRFYSFPLLVPNTEVFESYSLWKAEFDTKKEVLFNTMAEKLREEEERYSGVGKILEKIENIDSNEKKILQQLLLNSRELL